MLRGTILILLWAMFCPEKAVGQAVVHLTFDDPQNLTADRSGRGNHAAPQGNLAASSGGSSGGAVSLDGTSSLQLGASVAQTLGGSFTVSLWVRTTLEAGQTAGGAEQGAGLIFGSADDEADHLPVALTGNKAGFGRGQSTLHSQSAINHGGWVNVVVTRDKDTGVSSLFINGKLEASSFQASTAHAVHQLLLLGANPGQGLHFAGELDDFQLYDRAIPASDVAYLHANPGSALFRSVPEPATSTLMTCGLIVAFSFAWRQRRRSAAAARPLVARSAARHASRQANLSLIAPSPDSVSGDFLPRPGKAPPRAVQSK